MKPIFALTPFIYVLTTWALCACSLFDKEKSDKEESKLGWRSAGLELVDADETGGVHRMVNIEEDLFVMDAYIPKQDPYTNWDSIIEPYKWRLWRGQVGSLKWDTISMPEGNTPNRFVVLDRVLYVGTKYSGQIWKFNPKENQWQKVSTPELAFEDGTTYSVSLGSYKGELFASFASSKSNKNICWIGGVQDKKGNLVPCFGRLKNIPPDEVQEFGEYLYGISAQYGVYRYQFGDSIWARLPSPRGLAINAADSINKPMEQVSALGIHKQKLYFGYKGGLGLYRMEADGSYTDMTPIGGGASQLREADGDIQNILSYKGHLLYSGVTCSTPTLLVPQDSAKPQFGDWKIVGKGWCLGSYGCGVQSWGLVGIGDTLYATAWGYVTKIPLSQMHLIANDFYPYLNDTLAQARK